MRLQGLTFVTIATLLGGLHALTITSPSGGFLDPTQIITVTWTHTDSDPTTFNLIFDSTDGGQAQTVGSDISTATGSFQIPANTVWTWGSTFVLTAQDLSGNTLGKSGTFGLAQGVYLQTTDANGATTLISSPASEPAAASPTSASIVAASNTSQESPTITGTMTEMSTLAGSTSGNSFMTSTTATTRSSSTSRSTSSSATATTSANAQPRLGKSSEIILSAAGVMAGLVALFA